MTRSFVVGTRSSKLAIKQTELTIQELLVAHPNTNWTIKEMATAGDERQLNNVPLPPTGIKGLFTAELEDALATGKIDLAIHSMKDLPCTIDSKFTIPAIPRRESPFDVLITKEPLQNLHSESKETFNDASRLEPASDLSLLPKGAVIGTSSARRAAQIKNQRPDLEVKELRGNVDTRTRKLFVSDSPYYGIILAKAGIDRLGLKVDYQHVMDPNCMLPAAGQGALGIQCRSSDGELIELLKVIDHPQSRAAVTAERAFIETLLASCNTPIGAYAYLSPTSTENSTVNSKVQILMNISCYSINGLKAIRLKGSDALVNAEELGKMLGVLALQKGFRDL